MEEREEWGQKSERKEPAIGGGAKSIRTKEPAKGSPTLSAQKAERDGSPTGFFAGQLAATRQYAGFGGLPRKIMEN